MEEYDKVETQSCVSDKEDLENDENDTVEARSYYTQTSTRLSIFSRISEVSFQTLSSKYQFFILFCAFLMIFIIGFIFGIITAKFLIGSGHVQDKQHITTDDIPFNKI